MAIYSFELLFCPDCKSEVEAYVEDCSFDHEFGVERIYDYYCVGCNHLLHTHHGRMKPEIEEP